jgi:hypothetical protein
VSVILVLIASLSTAAPAAGDVELARQAEGSFAEGARRHDDAASARPHFARAAALYEQLRQRGADSPALYRNLGHAYLLAGDLPRAILSYREGLQRTPWDTGLRDDLADARARVVASLPNALGRPPAETRPPWWPRTGSGPPALLAALLYVLAWPCLTRWRVTQRGRPLMAGLVLLAGAVVLAGFAVASWRLEHDEAAHPLAVITADGIRLRRGDGTTYPPRYDARLRPGVEARLLHARGNWVQLELASGEVGWLPHDAVVIDASGG